MFSIFLPTPSARRATLSIGQMADNLQISTHALREEGDVTGIAVTGYLDGFLPTPSARRATSSISASNVIGNQFLPTPSARRAT